MGELTLGVLSAPYLAVVAALLVLGVTAVVVRGDATIRLGLLILVAGATPWAAGLALAGATRDPLLAERILRVGMGGLALIGPGLLMVILAISGRFDGHRGVVALAFACAAASTAIAWTTPWITAGVRETSSGLLYPRPGWFQPLHIGQIPLWGVVGVLISRRGIRVVPDDRYRRQRRRMVAVITLAIAGTFDSLLAHGLVGFYPVSWLPALFAIAIAMHSIRREDLLRARGVDVPAVVELVTLAGIGGALLALTWGGHGAWLDRPLAAALVLAPLPTFGLVAAWTIRIRRRRLERASDVAAMEVDRFADEVRDLPDEEALAARLAEALAAHAPVGAVRVWRFDEDGGAAALVPADAAPPRIDARVRAWLVANPEPIVVAELATRQLGGLRALIEELVATLAADLILPLVDRDGLVGMAVGNLPPFRVLRDEERDYVVGLATAAARGVTFLSLTREATHLASTAREVELAEAVAHARVTGDVAFAVGRWQVLGHYRPAARVAGDVWSYADLGDDRLLVFVGDVAGRGVPSALVSAAVSGVCETAPALLGAALEPRALLELVHHTVRDLGQGTQRVSAFAAVLDGRRGVVRYACAGQRGGYLVHPPPDGEARARLDVLAARSTLLGEPALVIGEGERPLAPDDVLVASSDGVLELRDGRGEPWGDRRLQRMLRDQLLEAGDRAARMIIAASVAHAGDAAVADDLLVVVARPAAAPAGGA